MSIHVKKVVKRFGAFNALREIDLEVGDGAAVYQSLLKQGVIVRPIANYGMPEYLRVSIGLFSENERFLMALKQAITA